MKKLLTFALALVLALTTLCFVACGEDEGDPNLGTYKITSMTYDGATINVGDDAPWGATLTADSMVITLSENGAGTLSQSYGTGDPDVSPITWTLDGQNLSITAQFGSGEDTITGTLNNGAMVLSLVEEGVAYNLAKV